MTGERRSQYPGMPSGASEVRKKIAFADRSTATTETTQNEAKRLLLLAYRMVLGLYGLDFEKPAGLQKAEQDLREQHTIRKGRAFSVFSVNLLCDLGDSLVFEQSFLTRSRATVADVGLRYARPFLTSQRLFLPELAEG